MQCVVSEQNVKTFARALHCLGKIGDDLYLDPSEDGLSIQSTNSSRSAFLSFTFRTLFFSHYDLKDSIDAQCRISLKGVLTAFRSLLVIEKTVETCSLDISPSSSVQIIFSCKHSVKKTFVIPFSETESLNHVHDISSYSNKFTTQSNVLSEAVLNFLSNQEEVSMIVTETSFFMKNYVENNIETDNHKEDQSVHTELTLQTDEFQEYDITNNCTLTFCLKEFRAFISFAESLSLSLTSTFEDGGQPIVFSVTCHPILEASLVMATLGDEENSQPPLSNDVVRRRYSSTQKPSSFFVPSKNSPDLTPIRNHLDTSIPSNPPPSKKTKYYFQRCFDNTFNPMKIIGADKILAPDSSDEDNK